MSADLAALKAVMTKCHADVIAYVVTTKGCENIQDFTNLVKHSEYEEQLNAKVLAHTSQKDSDVQLSRLRTAWLAAKAANEQATQRQNSHLPEDENEPLDASTQASFLTAWEALYSIILPMFLQPCDALLGRLYREFTKLAATVVPTRKIRSLYQQTMPGMHKKIGLGNGISIAVGNEGEEQDATSVVEYYWCLRILAYAYSIVGQHKVKSKLYKDKEVLMAPLSTNQAYADECLKRACDKSASVRWLQENDELTRGKMVKYLRRGWPQGEALEQALADTQVHWSMGPDAAPAHPAKRSLPAEFAEAESDSPTKKPRTGPGKTGSSYKGQAICKKFNDNRGCTASEKHCPDKRAHVCDVLTPQGGVCGARDHARTKCPYWKP